jgi:hypothetical protein
VWIFVAVVRVVQDTCKKSQEQQKSQRIIPKIETIKLVVVMSAVDWWKSEITPMIAGDFDEGVQWKILRRCGKREESRERTEIRAPRSTNHPHHSHAMFTRCAQAEKAGS